MVKQPHRWAALWGRVLLFTWAAMLVQADAHAQRRALRAEYYSLDDGLSDRQINDLIQDGEGFVWLATPNGLNRFDGYEFINFNNHPDNDFHLSGASVERLDLDERGNLVIQYQNNKLFFDVLDPRTSELTKVRLFPEDGIAGYVRHVSVNRGGKIYLVSVQKQDREGTYVYRCRPGAIPAFELLFRIPEVHSSVSPSIDMVQLHDGSFLINDSELGLRLFSANGALLKSFTLDDFDCLDRPGRYPGVASFLHLDQRGDVWFSLAQAPGVFRYNFAQRFFEPVGGLPAEGNFTHLWEDRHGNVLLAQTEYAGVHAEVTRMHCVRTNGAVFDFSYLIQISARIQSAYADDFFKTIFLGIDTGLSIVQNNRSKIRTYLAQNLPPNRYGATMGGIAGDGRGTVYFTSEAGHWYALDLKTDFLDTMAIADEGSGRPVDLKYTIDIHLDSAGYLWGISNTRSGEGRLHRVDPEACTARTFTFPQRFTAFTAGEDGRFWLVCEGENEKGSLVSFDPGSGAFKLFTDQTGHNPLRGSVPHYILAGKGQRFWIGTDNGLFLIDPIDRVSRTYSIQSEAEHEGLSSNTVFGIHQDSLGRLWLGTNNGLNILDPVTRQVRTLDKRRGLISNTVYGILPDGSGNYWISTNNGLAYYDPGRDQIRNFYAEDGLSNDQFNSFSFYRDETGRFYFGSVNGINAFYPEDLLINDPPPPVVLTRLTRYNSRRDSLLSECRGLCNLGREVVISPYDIYFQLHFMLPNFSSPRKNQFRAWLVGYEKDWIYLGNTPNIRYSKLPPGRYTLRLNGADPNGNWSETSISIPIRVRPIFYRTWWFILLAGLSIIGAIYLWLKIRVEQKLKVERLRTKLSSDLHDEVSGLLSGIAMQTDVMQDLVPEPGDRERLRGIGEKSRKAMSKMSDVIWSIDSRNDRVNDLLLRMYEHAEEILSPLDISYTFHVRRLDRNIKMPVKIRQELYFIFKEAINNVAKHSNASRVEVFLGNQGSQFGMTIHDSGPAKPRLNGHVKTGQGLANIRMRAQRIQAQLDIVIRDGYTIQLKMKKFA